MFSFQKPTHILVYRKHQIRMIDTEIWNRSQIPFGKIYLLSIENAGEKWKGVNFLCYLGRLNSEKEKRLIILLSQVCLVFCGFQKEKYGWDLRSSHQFKSPFPFWVLISSLDI